MQQWVVLILTVVIKPVSILEELVTALVDSSHVPDIKKKWKILFSLSRSQRDKVHRHNRKRQDNSVH